MNALPSLPGTGKLQRSVTAKLEEMNLAGLSQQKRTSEAGASGGQPGTTSAHDIPNSSGDQRISPMEQSIRCSKL